MAQYQDDDRVWIYNANTQQRYKIAWSVIKSPAFRKRNNIELIDEPEAPPTTEETQAKVEKLKAEFAEKPVKKESAPEPQDEPDEEVDESNAKEFSYADHPEIMETMSAKELKVLADDRGIKYAKNARQDKMIELLTA